MDLATKPPLIEKKWAASATGSYVRTVPFASSPTPGAASFTDGFPPLNGQPITSGGIPPDQRDVNGVLQMLSDNTKWLNAGANFQYNSSFSTAVGGYPKGARLLSTDGVTVWVSGADNNTTDPDGMSPANWKTETANLTVFTADDGVSTPGHVGIVPAPAVGDALAGFPLLAGGMFGALNLSGQVLTGSGTASSGHIIIGGYYIQWGTATVAGNGGTQSITWDTPFPTGVLLALSGQNTNTTGSIERSGTCIYSVSTTGATLGNNWTSSSTVAYLGIGK